MKPNRAARIHEIREKNRRYSASEVAKEAGASLYTVRAVISKLIPAGLKSRGRYITRGQADMIIAFIAVKRNEPLEKHGRPKTQDSKVLTAACVKLYLKYKSCDKVGKKIGLSRQAVWLRIKGAKNDK